METRSCSRCGEAKAVDRFYKSRTSKAGLQPHCKTCDGKRSTERLRAKSRLEVEAGIRREQVPTLIARELRTQGLKRCPGCRVTKPLEAFYEHKSARDGRAPHCIVCVNTKLRPAKKQILTEDQRRANREKVLRREFGISLEEYQAMHDTQGGVCAICGMAETGKTLAVDHCHTSGKIRGLLCGRCNPAVGFLRESPELARELAAYLEKHR